MNIQKKKILAKEIVYLFSLILCVLIFWTIVEMRNSHIHKRQEVFKSEFANSQSRLDSLKEKTMSPERMKQMEDNLIAMFERGASDDDGRRYMKEFEDKYEDKDVIDTISNLKQNLSVIEQKQQENSSRLLNNNHSDGVTKWFGFILLTILYPIRFIYLLLRWSIRILRQKTTEEKTEINQQTNK